jgi:hypothetical protein
VAQVAEQLYASKSTILGVGLTRAFRKTASEPAMHWLQINNIHLAANPYWQLADRASLGSSSPGLQRTPTAEQLTSSGEPANNRQPELHLG